MTEVLKSDLRKLSIDQLTDVMMRMGEPAFRSRQIYEWLWQKSATDIAEMTNLPLTLRKKLEDIYVINAIKTDKIQKS